MTTERLDTELDKFKERWGITPTKPLVPREERIVPFREVQRVPPVAAPPAEEEARLETWRDVLKTPPTTPFLPSKRGLGGLFEPEARRFTIGPTTAEPLAFWEQMLRETPFSRFFWADPKAAERFIGEWVMPTAALSGLPPAIAGWRALAAAPTVVKIAGRTALAPFVAAETAIGAPLKYGVVVPLRATVKGASKAGEKALNVALDTGLDKWLAAQGRRGEAANVIFRRFLTPENKIKVTELATRHYTTRLAQKKGAQWAAKQAADDTIKEIEPLLLQAVREPKPPVVERPIAPEVPPVAPKVAPKLAVVPGEVTLYRGEPIGVRPITEGAVPFTPDLAVAQGWAGKKGRVVRITMTREEFDKLPFQKLPDQIATYRVPQNVYEKAVAIPKAEPGMPEAGLQPSMLPEEIAAREVRPVGKGIVTQVSLDDLAKLKAAQAQAELAEARTPQEIAAQAFELTETKAGLEEFLATEPARKLIPLIKKTGAMKGEIPNLTLKQYRDITGKSEIKPQILTPDKKHIRWEYALDDVATEMGYADGETLREAIMGVADAQAQIKSIDASLRTLGVEGKEVAKLAEIAKPSPKPAPKPPTLSQELDTMYSQMGKEVEAFKVAVKGLRGEEAQIARGTLKLMEKQLANIQGQVKTIADLQAVQPAVKSLRQQIHAVAAYKGLPKTQLNTIKKETVGKVSLTQMTQPELEQVLAKVRDARPKLIGAKKVIKPATESRIEAMREQFIKEGKITKADYPAILRALKLPTDRYISGELFITESEGRSIIKAMRRKSLMGFATIEEAVNNLIATLGPPGKPPPTVITAAAFREPLDVRAFHKMESFLNRTYRVERILDNIDKFEEAGLFKKYIYRPINEATSQKIQGIYRQIEGLRGFLKENKINLGKLATDMTEVATGIRLSSSEKIGVYLHSLNPDNLRHLKEGNKFSDAVIETIKNGLTDEEKKVANWLSAYFQGEGPAISQARLYVEDKPLKLVENYFPIRLQWKANPELDYWEQIAKSDSLKFAAEWPMARIPKGFIKPRKPEAIQAVDLDALGVWLNHLEAVEHYKVFAPVIGDLQLILKNHAFKSALISKTNPAVYQVFDQWLKQVAEINPMRPTSHGEQLLRTLRVNAVTAVLGVNITTALKQFPSFVSGMAEIGEINAMKGLWTFLRHPVETRQLIKQYSPQIYKRSFEREIAEAKQMKSAGKLIGGKLSPREVFMFLTTNMDKLAVSGLWRGAFDDFLAKHPNDMKGAAEAGESVIRKTQPFFDVKDLAEFWRSGEFLKALTIFTNQLNQYWNYYRFDIAGKYGAGKIGTLEMLRRILWAFIVPALMIGAISRSDIPKNTKDLGKDLASMAIATIPILGNWIVSGIKGFADSGVITTELLDEIQRTSYNIGKANWDKAIQALPALVGYSVGFPVAQPKRTIQAIINLASDKSDDWLELIWGKYVREEARGPIGKAVKQISKAMLKIGQRDNEEAIKALEGVTDPAKRKEIWERDWTYSTGDLYTLLNNTTKDLDTSNLTTGNGFPPITQLYIESKKWIDYYYLHTDEGRTNLRENGAMYNAHLFFWGKLKKLYGNPSEAEERLIIINDWLREYQIPSTAIPELAQEIQQMEEAKAKRRKGPQPSPLKRAVPVIK